MTTQQGLLRRATLVLLVALSAAMLVGCAPVPTGPGTPGGAIAEIERAAAARDWDAYSRAWDMEAASTLFAQRYEEADAAAGNEKRGGQPAPDPSSATRTLPLVTAAIFVEAFQAYVRDGDTPTGMGLQRLLTAENVKSAEIDGTEAVVVVQDASSSPSTARLKLVRLKDYWIVVEVLNADEICRTGHALK